MRIYVDLDCVGSEGWRDWIERNSIIYASSHPFPMCGGLRLDGVSHYPSEKPDYIRYDGGAQ